MSAMNYECHETGGHRAIGIEEMLARAAEQHAERLRTLYDVRSKLASGEITNRIKARVAVLDLDELPALEKSAKALLLVIARRGGQQMQAAEELRGLLDRRSLPTRRW
jgi:hypothetical protein